MANYSTAFRRKTGKHFVGGTLKIEARLKGLGKGITIDVLR